MNIVCEKTLLSNAIDGVSRAVTLRSSISALEGIHMVADGFSLTLTCYNLELAITITIEANVRTPGECVLNAKLLGDMVRRMPSGEVKLALNDNGTVEIRGGTAKFELTALNLNDFPTLPNPGATPTLTLKASELHEMINKTIYAVSQDDKKPAHTGELFVIEPDETTVVAVDGYRLAILKRPFKAEKDIRIIIPSKTLTEVNKLIGDEDEEVQINANRQFVVFSTAKGYTILSRLIVGEFLNYEKALPAGCKTSALIDTREFIDCIERASLVITERLKDPLRIRFEDGKVTVNCKTSLGKVEDEFPAVVEGEPQEIGFNNRYLLDALRASGCAQVRMEMNGPLSPVKILPPDGEDFIYLVLPIRFKNE
mgnify:FL=1